MQQEIYPVFDFHCDLLSYVGVNEKHSLFDDDALCSLPQLRAGAIQIQVMAFFEDSTKPLLQNYQKQKEVFFSLKAEKNVTPLKEHLGNCYSRKLVRSNTSHSSDRKYKPSLPKRRRNKNQSAKTR